MPALFALTAISFTILMIDKNYKREYEFSFIKLRLFLPGFFVISLLLIITAGIYLYFSEPQNFLGIPSYHPRIWILIMFLYPVFSALPQEFVYRRFFFHRYSALFSDKDMIIFSAITFGLLHIIFHHWQSVLLSAAGGYLFARTYSQSRSLIITVIEHSIYGIIIFTIGLHQYFYDGPLLR
jgi:membrane protease YdiL (CAAX protease family)